MNKAVTTYGADFLSNIREDGRIHSSFFPFTGAGRYASSDPNLQNIPRTKKWRSCFEPDEGHSFNICDYSNIEMVVCAEITKDPALTKIFRSGDDAHYATAQVLLGKSRDQITKKERQEAKPVNFGLCYGMGAEKLVLYALSSYKVILTLAQAKNYRDRYFENYAGVAAWHARLNQELEEHKKYDKRYEARTLAGRRRYMDPNTAYNETKNTPVQGTGADGLKAALRCVYLRLRKYGAWNGPARLVHHVHDEILVETKGVPANPADREFLEQIKKELEEGMLEGMQPLLKRVPVKAEAATGATWADKA
jgi:DNA polymerase I-like protein with 3'-5' exonuclease and polymerase domains